MSSVGLPRQLVPPGRGVRVRVRQQGQGRQAQDLRPGPGHGRRASVVRLFSMDVMESLCSCCCPLLQLSTSKVQNFIVILAVRLIWSILVGKISRILSLLQFGTSVDFSNVARNRQSTFRFVYNCRSRL